MFFENLYHKNYFNKLHKTLNGNIDMKQNMKVISFFSFLNHSFDFPQEMYLYYYVHLL